MGLISLRRECAANLMKVRRRIDVLDLHQAINNFRFGGRGSTSAAVLAAGVVLAT
jgi:hypothetical protein